MSIPVNGSNLRCRGNFSDEKKKIRVILGLSKLIVIDVKSVIGSQRYGGRLKVAGI